MYARFYRAKRRVVVNLVHSRKFGGQARSEHIARLGSIIAGEEISLSERQRFWQEAQQRLDVVADRLGERFSDDVRRKVIAGIEARIPKPADAEERQAEIRAFVAKARLMSKRRGKRAAGDAPPIAASVRRQSSRKAAS
jgi:hypothetical protein